MSPLALWIEELGRAGAGAYLLTGVNGSGKSTLARQLAAAVPGAQLVSAETEQAFYEDELRKDESNFQELADEGTTVRRLLGDRGAEHPLVAQLGLGHVLDRGYRRLSSGEARKTSLVAAVVREARVLVLDEPFDGLDREARAELWLGLRGLATHVALVLVGTFEPGPTQLDFAAVRVCERGEIAWCGSEQAWTERPQAVRRVQKPPIDELGPRDLPADQPLVALHGGSLVYDDRVVFSGLELVVRPGEHTLIEGPNGSGKSSLLSMLTGDHPQAYSNDLTLFGRRRGTGETIWDIKKRVGLLSGQLHRDYRVGGSALEVILSGLFDSIGLYEKVEPSQRKLALRWWDWLELTEGPETAFRALSFGQQRLVLLCRAAIKVPALLVLDEPTTGLDEANRRRVLGLVESLSCQTASTVLFVSHRADDREHWLDHVSQRVVRLAGPGAAG